MSTYPCCEHCAEDKIHDVPKDGHEIPCNTHGLCSTRPDENTVWTQNAALRATTERVKALIDDPQVLDDWIAISKVRAAIEGSS